MTVVALLVALWPVLVAALVAAVVYKSERRTPPAAFEGHRRSVRRADGIPRSRVERPDSGEIRERKVL